MSPPSDKVVRLHIGAPKTGTTYVQDRLTKNAASLARHGVAFPRGGRLTPAHVFHFRAALDLLGDDWGGPPGHAEGAWSQMVQQVRRAKGSVIVSHEILASAHPEQITRALNDLSGEEVHVVYSARDLARALPAAWQESLKQGGTTRFRTFARRFERAEVGSGRALDLPGVLDRWGAHLPPERISVVVVPPRRADRHGGELWQRFCTALAIEPEWAPLDSDQANTSLRAPEAQLLRRLNRQLERRSGAADPVDLLLLDMLRTGELASGSGPRITLSPERHDWAAEQADRWIDWIKGAGVRVVGDVEELRPIPPDPDQRWVDPDRVRAKLVNRAAIRALAAMTHEAARRTDPDQALGQRLRRGVRLMGS